MVDVRHEQRAGVAQTLAEGRLEHDAVGVALNDLLLVQTPAEWAMDEELDALWAVEREARDILAGIGDQMPARLDGQIVGGEPVFEHVGAGEDADAVTLAEPITRFLPDDARAVFHTFLANGSSGHPQFLDLDAAVALVLRSPIELEEAFAAAAVVVVEVREADHVIVVTLCGPQISLQLRRQIDALVAGIVGVARVGVVEEHLSPVREIEPGAVSIGWLHGLVLDAVKKAFLENSSLLQVRHDSASGTTAKMASSAECCQ
jgi:hypothetical protein